jgi:phosphatidylinositol alpha 1,6-mannosyltransferase
MGTVGTGTLATVRVAIVTESFLPTVNGVSGSVARVADHLRERGHPALVIAPGPGGDDYAGAPVVRVASVGLPVVSSLPVGLPGPRILAELARFGPDVVHLASPFIVGAGGLVAARRLGVPVLAVYQTDVAGFASAYGLGRAGGLAWRWTAALHRRAALTLAPSNAAAEALRRHGVPRVALWPRGVDSELFHPGRRDQLLRARLAPAGELLVGYVGRLAPEKHVERLAALRGLPGVRLVVVGDGPSRERLRRVLPDAVFLGLLRGAELAAAYASLDVFVHTGPFETFCQSVQEAMAAGLPVIAPDAGGPRDLVRPGRSGFLLPVDDDGHGLRAAVAALAAEPDLRLAFGRAGRRLVAARSWPRLCEQLLDHYASVVGSGTADRPAA